MDTLSIVGGVVTGLYFVAVGLAMYYEDALFEWLYLSMSELISD